MNISQYSGSNAPIRSFHMTSNASPDNQATQASLQALRLRVIDRIWTGMAFLAAVGIPISVSRFLSTGWLRLYTIHLCIGAAIIVANIFRKHLSFTAKITIIMALFWGIGLSGLFTIGLLGAGIWWLAVSGLIMSMMYSFRAGLVTILLAAIATVLASAGFIKGFLSLPIDANLYLLSPTSWITVIVAMCIMPIVVFQAITSLYSNTVILLQEIDAQKKEIQRLATHDQLTGIPTLSLAMDRLSQALLNIQRSEKKIALLFIDLDGFKAVNDNYGHAAGDFVLKEVARRCSGVMRADDTISRIGGDEFLAILLGISNPNDASMIAQKIISAVSVPFDYQSQHITIGASIGVAVSDELSKDADALVKTADEAMYRAKRSGKNQVVVTT